MRFSAVMGPVSSWDARYGAVYYPGTLNINEATRVEVKAGQEINDLNVQLTRHEGVTISGRVVFPSGVVPPRYLNLRLSGQWPGFRWSNYVSGMNGVTADGTFVLRHIQPGDYILSAGEPSESAPGDLVAHMPLTVGSSNISGIELQMKAAQAFDISGKITVDGASPPGSLSIRLAGATGRPKMALSNEDGTFVVKDVMPGVYTVDVYPGPNTEVRFSTISAKLGNRIAAREESLQIDSPQNEPLEIRIVELSGQQPVKVLDVGGRPVARAMIRLVGTSPEPRVWGGTGANGETVILAAPGEYRVFVTTEPPPFQSLDDPDFLNAHEKDFPPVRVVAGKNAMLVLTLPAQ